MWRYRNPVEVKFGAGVFDDAGQGAGRPLLLPGHLRRRQWRRRLRRPDAPGRWRWPARPPPRCATSDPIPISSASPSPAALYAAATRPVEAIVALGGGSVMDAAKVLAAASGDFDRVRRYLETGTGRRRHLAARRSSPSRPPPAPAARSRRWATVWDTERHEEILARPRHALSRAALVDPLLTLGLPRGHHHQHRPRCAQPCARKHLERERQSGVGALAEVAAREVLDALPLLADDLGNEALRTRLARASLFAGLAFSNTRTRCPRALLSSHAASRRAARHRLLLQPAAW